MTLTALIARRLLLGLLILLIVSMLVFIGTEILPGDVAQAILGQGATPELIENVRARLGLNEPAYVRYFTWLRNLLTGNLGTSLANGSDISSTIGERIGNTVLLAGSTALIAVPLAIVLGLLCALKPGGTADRIISTVSISLISVPDFLIAILLVTLFAVQLGWLPAIANLRPGQDFSAVARMMVLPVTVLVFTVLAHMVRMTIGADHRVLMPASALVGACFLVAADTVARTIIAPTEIPVGVVTAICGGPFFIYLLVRNRSRASML